MKLIYLILFSIFALSSVNVEAARRKKQHHSYHSKKHGHGSKKGCGSRGGPGWRKANGKCASWRD